MKLRENVSAFEDLRVKILVKVRVNHLTPLG